MNANENIRVYTEDRTARVTLDRAPLNVLDIAMMQAISRELAALLQRPDGRCDFIVFQGAGAKAFSAGAEVRDHLPERAADMLAAFHGVFRQLARADCLTIAAVHGHCLGGGMELAMFCDFVIATESAKFGQPEIKLGCFPPVALAVLPTLSGTRAAVDLILTGRTISAREAQQFGLVSRVVPDDQLAASVDALLGELLAMSPAVLRMTAKALRRGARANFERTLDEVEGLFLKELMKTEDAVEGIHAFLEKRAPAWKGR